MMNHRFSQNEINPPRHQPNELGIFICSEKKMVKVFFFFFFGGKKEEGKGDCNRKGKKV